MTCFFFSLIHFKHCIEPYCVFVPTLFCYGMQKEIRTQWNRAERCKQGKTKTTKNLLQIHISSTSFLKSGNLEMFYNELKSWSEDFWNSKKKKKSGKRAHAKTETTEVFGSLCNVLLFWLHVKMLNFWKQPPKLLGYVTEYLGVGRRGLTKKPRRLTKNVIKRIEHIQNIPTKWKRTQTQQNSFSFVWGPSAINFKLLLLTETIIGLKPLCM